MAVAVDKIEVRALTPFGTQGVAALRERLNLLQTEGTIIGRANSRLGSSVPAVEARLNEFKMTEVENPFTGTHAAFDIRTTDITTGSYYVPTATEYGWARNDAATFLRKAVREIDPGLFVQHTEGAPDEINFQNADTFMRIFSPFDMASQMFGKLISDHVTLGSCASRLGSVISVMTDLSSHETFGVFKDGSLQGYLLGLWLKGNDVTTGSYYTPIASEYDRSRMAAKATVKKMVEDNFPWFNASDVTGTSLLEPQIAQGFNMAISLNLIERFR